MDIQYFTGIDIGSSTSKVVIIDENNNIISYIVKKTGINMEKIALEIFESVKKQIDQIIEKTLIISTGYGRKNVSFANKNVTEITCTARSAFEFYSDKSTVVDIGGQDNKVIFLSEDGSIQHFKLNRKCAAGTGAFLEEIAWKLDLSVSEMDKIARSGTSNVLDKPLNSFCSVFAATEIIERIRQGEAIENMLMSGYQSIVRRIFDMGQLYSPIVMSGGAIQYHPMIGDILYKKYNFKVLIPPIPQILPAYGAALISHDIYLKKLENKKQSRINIHLPQ